ncbi:MAG: nucleotidyltransferase [Ferruginibacter sp.]|nr:nucleotidyltransferase [Ferruginibacter sp.]
MGPEATETSGLECIILAGGLGTRLKSAVPDLPKCMAPVAGKPFLHYIIEYLLKQNVSRFIFSLGYMHEHIENYILKNYPHIHYVFSVEKEPLGTGGAVLLACQYAQQKNVLVLNGDTMFRTDIQKLMSYHIQHEAVCTLSLKPMQNFDRYGVVELNKEGYISSFREKKFYEQGNINGGVYALNVEKFIGIHFAEKFSFEIDYLERYHDSQKMMGLIQDEYFIDIGIPEDFERAGKELSEKQAD